MCDNNMRFNLNTITVLNFIDLGVRDNFTVAWKYYFAVDL